MNELQLQVFLEYTRRFEAMSAELPMFIRLNDPTGGIKPHEDPYFLESFMLRYLNICSEEWFLQKSGMITKEVWELWKHYIEGTLKDSKPFGEFWWTKSRENFLKPDGSTTEFVDFVDATVAKKENISKSQLAVNHTFKRTQES
jgi:hypothetical protein